MAVPGLTFRVVREALEAEGRGLDALDGGLVESEGLEHVLPDEGGALGNEVP